MRERAHLYFMASRPFSLTAAIVPVVVGTLAAADGKHGRFNPLYFLLALAGSVLIQMGTNLVNDYYDHVKGVDGPTSLGPSHVIQTGLMRPVEVLWLGIACFAAGAACGLVLVAFVGLPLLWLGLASVAAGFFYTGAPISLAYVALGELTVFFFMGPAIVMGAFFVQTGHWGWTPFVVSLPIAFLVTAILHANNLRDIDDDRRHGKRTLATIIGRNPANWEYYLLIASTYVALVAMVATRVASWPVLLSLLTLPAAVRAVNMTAHTQNPRKLNYVLKNTAELHMRFGALMAAGLIVALIPPFR
ncbi:MAG: 1,4-dihydroxy-2-naphthoate octaprenyltransferase [Dehalococcoidia bacterium]